jgi:hypothetical protein
MNILKTMKADGMILNMQAVLKVFIYLTHLNVH